MYPPEYPPKRYSLDPAPVKPWWYRLDGQLPFTGISVHWLECGLKLHRSLVAPAQRGGGSCVRSSLGGAARFGCACQRVHCPTAKVNRSGNETHLLRLCILQTCRCACSRPQLPQQQVDCHSCPGARCPTRRGSTSLAPGRRARCQPGRKNPKGKYHLVRLWEVSRFIRCPD